MTAETTLEEAVNSWGAEPDNDDRVIELVKRHGVYDAEPLAHHSVPIPKTESMRVYTPGDVPEEVLETLAAFVREYRPSAMECYANAAELARFDSRFQYIEGVTANAETGSVHNHAWNVINGTPVDVTRYSDERYGVHIPNAVLREALPTLESANQWNILENEAVPTKLRPPYDNDN
jgi:hypothetical protein